MKHFIISLHYLKPIEEIDRHLVEHRAYLDKGYQGGILMASGPKNPREGGILLGRAETLESMKDFCLNDPFSIHSCARYEFTEFIPVKFQDEFKNWFHPELG